MGHYRRAADQIYESAAVWAHALDELTLAYWRHCALVWITLWHIADVPGLTVDQAAECLTFSFTGEGDLDRTRDRSEAAFPLAIVRRRQFDSRRLPQKCVTMMQSSKVFPRG